MIIFFLTFFFSFLFIYFLLFSVVLENEENLAKFILVFVVIFLQTCDFFFLCVCSLKHSFFVGC